MNGKKNGPIGTAALALCLIAGTLCALGSSRASAQAAASDYPSHPVKIVYPYAVGGSGDALTRLWAQQLGEQLRGTFVPEFRPGGNTIPGATTVARAPADGYTLLLSSAGTFVFNSYLYDKISYDAEKDFDVLAVVGEVPIVAVVRADSPHKDLSSFVAYAKANPGKISYGTVARGSTSHLTSELLKKTTGISMVAVPYPGSAPGQTDLIGGRIDVMFDSPTASLGMIKAGRIRPLAFTGQTRFFLMPETPTMAETFPGLIATGWFALAAPKGLPAEVRSRLKAAIAKVLESPENRAAMERLGFAPGAVSQPDLAMATYLKAEHDRWGPLIRELNLKLDNN